MMYAILFARSQNVWLQFALGGFYDVRHLAHSTQNKVLLFLRLWGAMCFVCCAPAPMFCITLDTETACLKDQCFTLCDE